MAPDLSYLRTFACQAQGCADYADYGRHAPNCVQDEFNIALDEIERLRAENDLHQHNYAESVRTVAALARNAGGVLRLPDSVVREVEGYVEVSHDYGSGETVIRGR